MRLIALVTAGNEASRYTPVMPCMHAKHQPATFTTR